MQPLQTSGWAACIGRTRTSELSGNSVGASSLPHPHPHPCTASVLPLGHPLARCLCQLCYLWVRVKTLPCSSGLPCSGPWKCCRAALGSIGAAKLVLSTVVLFVASPKPQYSVPLASAPIPKSLSFPSKWPLAVVVQRAVVLGRFLLSNLSLL